MIALWRIRQFSCVDANGRVVGIRSKKGIGHARVVGWRVRWDGPGAPDRSRSFMKSRYDNATAACVCFTWATGAGRALELRMAPCETAQARTSSTVGCSPTGQ